MPNHSLLVSAGYAAFTAAIGLYEARRIRGSGPDVVTVFMTIFVMECCIPGILIYACLPFVNQQQPTGVSPVDRILLAADLSAALLVLGLTAGFAFLFYVFTAFFAVLLDRFWARRRFTDPLVLTGHEGRLLIVLGSVLVISMISFYVGGDSLVERYINLILIRSSSSEARENILSALVANSNQGWAWLSIAALFVTFERHGRRFAWFFCLLCAVIFAVLAVDRRAIFIPFLLGYLTLVLFDGRWRMRALLIALVLIAPWLAYGKELLSTLAFSGNVENAVATRYDTVASGLLRVAAEAGITIIESLGSVNLLDLPPRLGIDHLLSVLPRTYIRSLNLGLDLPQRIVRVSTEAFASADDADIPPGLLGQMWLDFRAFGPIAWAFALSLQMSLVQWVFARTARTRQATAAFAIVTFVIALPLNTGSYDFTFTLDMPVLLLGLAFTFRLQRALVPPIQATRSTCP